MIADRFSAAYSYFTSAGIEGPPAAASAVLSASLSSSPSAWPLKPASPIGLIRTTTVAFSPASTLTAGPIATVLEVEVDEPSSAGAP